MVPYRVFSAIRTWHKPFWCLNHYSLSFTSIWRYGHLHDLYFLFCHKVAMEWMPHQTKNYLQCQNGTPTKVQEWVLYWFEKERNDLACADQGLSKPAMTAAKLMYSMLWLYPPCPSQLFLKVQNLPSKIVPTKNNVAKVAWWVNLSSVI